MSTIQYCETREIPLEKILALYIANSWSSANKPDQLYNGLCHSHTLITAWDRDHLVGLGNAISDGYLVVYFPHLLVHPDYQRRGIGSELVKRLMVKYQNFHQCMLVADARAVAFYKKCGFVRAGKTEPMWIYAGRDH